MLTMFESAIVEMCDCLEVVVMDWKRNLFFGLVCAVMSVAGTGCVTARQLRYGTAAFKDWQRTEADRRIVIMSDTNRWEGSHFALSMEKSTVDPEQGCTNVEYLVLRSCNKITSTF
jgi:hypothetical protein